MITNPQGHTKLMKHSLASRYGVAAGLVGLFLLIQHFVLNLLSEQFFYEGALIHSPILLLVTVQVAAGLVFLSMFWVIPRLVATRNVILCMLGIGLLLRLILFDSTPILEDDFYRYLWDGAVVVYGWKRKCFDGMTSSVSTRQEIFAIIKNSVAQCCSVAAHVLLRTAESDIKNDV